MGNPFKFGGIVDEPFFTNRVDELTKIQTILDSENHLVVISPRRFGKTSLIKKAVKNNNRTTLFLDIQLMNSVEDLAAQYLRRIYKLYPMERVRQFIANFRVIPTLSLHPVTNEVEVSFQPTTQNVPLLEDVFNLLEKLSEPTRRPVVILDEFQDILRLGEGIDRKLRAILQLHKNINYVFLGSQESMMREIFEKKKSPFYHFALLLPLDKINKEHFSEFLIRRFSPLNNQAEEIVTAILQFTDGHPYYTQRLAYSVWNLLCQAEDEKQPVEQAIHEIIMVHDFDYERLWSTFNNTDKRTLIGLSQSTNNPVTPLSRASNSFPASTVFSSLKRLTGNGIIMKTIRGYEIDDPFFRQWITIRRNE